MPWTTLINVTFALNKKQWANENKFISGMRLRIAPKATPRASHTTKGHGNNNGICNCYDIVKGYGERMLDECDYVFFQ